MSFPTCSRTLSTRRFVSTVEWSWSPAHERQDTYRLTTNRRRSLWILWVAYYDEWLGGWQHVPYAYGPRRGITAEDAAGELLVMGWTAEARAKVLG